MDNFFAQNKDFFDVLLQVVYLVVPIVISWVIRTYVQNSNHEKQLGSIIRLSNAAIDYVENLEKRGDLVVPENMKKGQQKLFEAAQWLEHELAKNGVKITNEDAGKWISSEFQKRMGGVQNSSITSDVARLAVDLIQGLEKGDLSGLTLNKEKLDILVGLAADWLATQLSEQRGVSMGHNEAETWVRAELMNRLQIKQLPSGDQLMDLARQAVGFMLELKATGRLVSPPGTSNKNMERDVAVAWMLTEAAKMAMTISPSEITRMISLALQERNATLGLAGS
jgi:hypothetical protein